MDYAFYHSSGTLAVFCCIKIGLIESIGDLMKRKGQVIVGGMGWEVLMVVLVIILIVISLFVLKFILGIDIF